MNRPSKRGLSLLEILVALALLAAIMVGLLAATRMSVGLLDRTATITQDNPALAMRVRLRGWLERAATPNNVTDIPLMFQGDDQAFTFTTFAYAGFATDSAALRITVELKEGDLSMITAGLDHDGNENASYTHFLAKNVSNASISYFDRASDVNDWVSIWDHSNRLPNLVRIEMDEGSKPDWPNFIVAPSMAQTPTE